MKIYYLAILLFLFSCTHKTGGAESGAEGGDEDAKVHTKTPVTISQVALAPISEFIDLNAQTQYIKKNGVHSSSTGYLDKILVQLGNHVHKGQVLFLLKTKEANALGNNLFPNDTSLRFSGLIKIKASQEGYITSMYHQLGDYVLEGDSLCSIVDRNSLVWMIHVPFEWAKYIHMGPCQIQLPDSRWVPGNLFQKSPVMDMVSQTETYMARVNSGENLPENLIGKVRIYKENRKTALTLPKSAILTNEEETEFWVMKLVRDTLAIKVPIQKGIETNSQVEILGNTLKMGDKIITTGNYGLPDSSTVFIQK